MHNLDVIGSEYFSLSLSDTLTFIALDSKSIANQFKNSLESSINTIPNMPYKCKKSIYFNDDNIRDYIFMGYCIPYLIEKEHNRIILIDIVKWKQF